MSPKDACGAAGRLRKLRDERAFAGAGFPADERNSSRPPACVEQVLRQFFELSLAFEQGHGPAVSAKRRRSKRCQRPRLANWGCAALNLGISADLPAPLPP